MENIEKLITEWYSWFGTNKLSSINDLNNKLGNVHLPSLLFSYVSVVMVGVMSNLSLHKSNVCEIHDDLSSPNPKFKM